MFCSVFTRGTTIPQKRQNDTKHVNYVLNLLLSPEILHGQKVIRQDENKSRWLFYYQYYFTEGLINVILHFQTIADADSFKQVMMSTRMPRILTQQTEYSCSFRDKRQITLKSKVCCDIPPDIMH